MKIHETTHTGETYGQSPKTLKRGEGWKFDEGDQKVEDSDEEPQDPLQVAANELIYDSIVIEAEAAPLRLLTF